MYDPQGLCIKESKVLILGITFKENCPDVRNTKVVDIVRALQEFDLQVDIYDPWASAEEVKKRMVWTFIPPCPTGHTRR